MQYCPTWSAPLPTDLTTCPECGQNLVPQPEPIQKDSGSSTAPVDQAGEETLLPRPGSRDLKVSPATTKPITPQMESATTSSQLVR